MADTGKTAWFYSKDGQQLGPVPHAELQKIIAAKQLDPAKDMVWNESLPNWVSLAEVMNQFDSAAPAKPTENATPAPAKETPTPATRETPATAKEQASLEQPFEPVDMAQLGESSNALEWPGARRRHYLIAVIVVPLLIGSLFGALAPTLEADTRDILNFGISLVLLIVTIVYSLKRLTNLDMSRWWFLGNFIPIVNLWVGYRCVACPAGYAHHGKMDKAGIILAIVYWLSLIALVLGTVWLVLYLMDRFANDPEFREEVRKFLIELRAQIEAQQS